ncbi:hypothetical protein, partial [Providencia huaxiensis]|uniref:hypothetical protein n=1 Tax=Providencia huaxiensis TaxID=2027290 RepID=UPI0034DD583E
YHAPNYVPFLFCGSKIKRFKIQFSQSHQHCKISSIGNFIADNEIPTGNSSTRVFHDSVSNGTVKLTQVRLQI